MTASRPILAPSHVTDSAAQQMAEFHRDFVDEVSQAVATKPVVVVGMKQNPVVKTARKALDDAGIPFHYIEHGSYVSGYRRRLAIKMWSGYPTFPQVFVRGVLLGGARELVAGLKDGSVQAKLHEKA